MGGGFLVVGLALAACGCSSPKALPFSVAADPRKDVWSRIDATKALTKDQVRRLRQDLESRLPPGRLDREALDAIQILAEIGDAATAQKLKGIFNHGISSPFYQAIAISILKIQERIAAASSPQPGHKSGVTPFEVALDPQEDIGVRFRALKKLDQQQIQRLRQLLESEVPGHWNLATRSTIEMLGYVGDAATIEKLKAMKRMPDESVLLFEDVILNAITLISARVEEAK
jgi:hypothetical protein